MNPNGVQFSHCGGGKAAYCYVANIVTLLFFTESYCDKLYVITVYVLPISETKCFIHVYYNKLIQSLFTVLLFVSNCDTSFQFYTILNMFHFNLYMRCY